MNEAKLRVLVDQAVAEALAKDDDKVEIPLHLWGQIVLEVNEPMIFDPGYRTGSN